MASHNSPGLISMGADLVARLGGTWRHDHGMCLCPAHADRRPSLSVRVGDHALLFKCFAGCEIGDVIRALLRFDGHILDHDDQPWLSKPAGLSDERRGRLTALRLWDQSNALRGSPGERYLLRRRVAILPPTLRYNPLTPLGPRGAVTFRPAMIAALHDAGRFVAVQRTFFDGHEPRRARDLEEPRMMLGRPRHGAVMLAPASHSLGLAEGVETALSAMILFDMPVWATVGAERFDQIALPPSVDRLILFPDNDRAGEVAAARASLAYAKAGRTIEILWPPARHKDWNDVLREGGKGVGEWWRQGV